MSGLFLVLLLLLGGCVQPDHDVIIRGGTVYDGSGGAPYVADIAISGDSIAAIGMMPTETARREIDATGLAVAPGFINMLSWAAGRLERDGRSMSDIVQGVTVEVFGEGTSEGPVGGRSLAAWMDSLADAGISTNIASFVGAATVRVHELGYADRRPTPEELDRMKALVRQAMEDGALGLGSSLIYAPGFYADTQELIELSRVVAEYDGLYISHMRSEGNQLLEALDELLTIAREADVRAEVWHLKMAGESNWHKFDAVVERIEAARAEGMEVAANMYTYTAGSTGLDAAMPPWVQEGGDGAWRERLMDPDIRARVLEEMRTPTNEWENLYLAAGAEGTLIAGLRQDSLRYLTGRRLSEIAAERGQSPEDVAIDLVIHDSSRVEVVYFLMSEENVRKQIALPWMTFGSDAGSMAPEGNVLLSSQHPRAYGNFARLLGRYVRDEGLLSLEEAVRRLTSMPAERLRLAGRGQLTPGYLADVVVFDPATIQDHATFENPHQLSTGVHHVVVNGEIVLLDGQHTGAMPGRALRRAEKR
ncbi:MAG: D-aminoacylase [Rhodothermales bacterium]